MSDTSKSNMKRMEHKPEGVFKEFFTPIEPSEEDVVKEEPSRKEKE